MEQNEQLLSYDERRRRALVIQRERREAQVRRNLRILTGVIITVLAAVTAAGIHTVTKKTGVKQSARQEAAAVHVQQPEKQQKVESSDILSKADRLAAMYDYDGQPNTKAKKIPVFPGQSRKLHMYFTTP